MSMSPLIPSRRGRPARLGLLVTSMAVLALAGTGSLGAGESAAAPPVTWSEQTQSATAKETGGRLVIAPDNAGWAASVVVSRDVLPFWSGSGTSITMHITPEISMNGGNLDGIITAGFITAEVVPRLQACDNFLGVNIACTKARNQCIISLARKEKEGEESIRGDSKGNPAGFPGGKSLIVPAAGGFDLVLKATETAITITVPGVGELTQPHGLAAERWRRPHLAIQSMHFNTGRMTIAVSGVGILQAALDPGLFHAIDLSAAANVGFADPVAGDKQGGWTDQGMNDLHHLRTGRQLLRSIPFEIADPAGTGRAHGVVHATGGRQRRAGHRL